MANRNVTSLALIRGTRGRQRWARIVFLLLLLAVAHSVDARDVPSELAVSFAVPEVVTPSESGVCRLTPSFERLAATSSTVQSFFPESAAQDAEVILIASSSDEKVERGVRVENPEFWQVTNGPASCLSKCVRLPLAAMLIELTLTYSNGREPCLIKPIDGRSTPTLSGIVCQDSAWPEVLVQPGPRTVICATATNFRGLQRPTLHRLLLKYRSAVKRP